MRQKLSINFYYYLKINNFLEYKNRILIKIKETKAIKFFDKKLKHMAFKALKNNLTETKNEIFKIQKAEKFDSFWCKKIIFIKWLDRLEDKNEIKSMHLLFKARKKYESYLLRTGLSTWKYFVKQKKKFKVNFTFHEVFF